jgi:hypothetical protein
MERSTGEHPRTVRNIAVAMLAAAAVYAALHSSSPSVNQPEVRPNVPPSIDLIPGRPATTGEVEFHNAAVDGSTGDTTPSYR